MLSVPWHFLGGPRTLTYSSPYRPAIGSGKNFKIKNYEKICIIDTDGGQ